MHALRDTIFVCLESPEMSGGQETGRPPALSARAATTRPTSRAADPAGAPLASLAGGALASRLRAFRGASGRRYVTTVFEVADREWTLMEAAVVLVVARAGGRIVAAHAAADGAARGRLRARLLAAAGESQPYEIHLHFLAVGAAARRAAAIDLIGAPH